MIAPMPEAERDSATSGESSAQERREFADSLRRLLASEWSLDSVRSGASAEPSVHTSLWNRLVDQMGLPGVAIPEEFGGSGLSDVEQVVAFTETGRALAAGPLLSTAGFASSALTRSGDRAAQARLLPMIAAGAIGAVAHADHRGGVHAGTGVTATRSSTEWLLNGTAAAVLHGQDADVLLVFAESAEGLTLFEVPSTAGLTRVPREHLDLTRGTADLHFASTQAVPVGPEGAGTATRRHMIADVSYLVAAEAVGGSERCLEMARDYAVVRHQFGRAIGSFQAIKHRLAHMAVAVESSRAALEGSMAETTTLPAERAALASAVKSYCCDAFLDVARSALHVHGGIGFTWEHDAHLYLRRAKALQLIGGPGHYHRGLVAAHLGLE